MTQRYVEVFWTPFYNGEINDAAEIIFQAPKPLFSILKEERKNAMYLKCPAFIDNVRNSYAVLSPFDLNITFDYPTRSMNIDRYGQQFFDATCVNRGNQTIEGNPYMATLPIRILFFSKENVEVTSGDLPILNPSSIQNFKVIGGGFNISKWYRAVELSIEVKDPLQPISLKTDEPLFLVKFKTPKDLPIKMTRIELTPKLRVMTQSCVAVKKFRPGLKMAENYALAADYIKAFWRKG
jgi:hypothetical protein